jgi:hypothetical protein
MIKLSFEDRRNDGAVPSLTADFLSAGHFSNDVPRENADLSTGASLEAAGDFLR